MRRIVMVLAAGGLLAACGQEAQPVGPDGAPAQTLDYIDAVPIDKDAPPPVVQPQTADKKEEPEQAREEERAEETAAPAAATVGPAAQATPTPPRPAAPANDAAAATRRANEAVAPRSETEVPYSPN
ncbi:hypothetical protein [Brevundimonas sp. NIBR11]|uniref:hypothetical protein n=1 Tax=Brevundimonas sp. NIBR11 TaxID=3015999 RepID=UPI0022F06B78|nr:hypothetical protein [Brevundimonas sp. NIBR11]WGM30114.1 hypothetical protein KKHFBJBL_00329 [Brevundimonas sp. NIBR11]